MMFVKTFLVGMVFSLFAGCASFDSGTVDKELGDLMPKEAALKVVNDFFYISSDLKIPAKGIGMSSCSKLEKPGKVSDIRGFPVFHSFSNGNSYLRIHTDHSDNTLFCLSGLIVSGVTESQARDLLTALKSLGAPISKFSIIRQW